MWAKSECKASESKPAPETRVFIERYAASLSWMIDILGKVVKGLQDCEAVDGEWSERERKKDWTGTQIH